jgi:hypothetical protein
MIVMNSDLPYPDDGTTSSGRNAAAVRRDAWLHQMEAAMMAQMNQPGKQSAVREDASRSDQEKAMANQEQSERNAHTLLSEEAGSQAARDGLSCSQLCESDGMQKAQESRSNSQDSGSHQLCERDLHQLRERELHQLRDHDEVRSRSHESNTEAKSRKAAFRPLTHASAPGFIMAGAFSASVMSAAVARTTEVTTAVASVSRSLPTGANVLDARKGEAKVSAEGKEQTPADTAESAQEHASTGSWERRRMHLMKDGDDVHLWIRDSQLGSHETRAVVQRLAADFSGTGIQLRGATVNGRLVYGMETTDGGPSDAFDSQDGNIATTRPTFITSSKGRK